jgi:Clp amino terminal domain, pathogenicity island component
LTVIKALGRAYEHALRASTGISILHILRGLLDADAGEIVLLLEACGCDMEELNKHLPVE